MERLRDNVQIVFSAKLLTYAKIYSTHRSEFKLAYKIVEFNCASFELTNYRRQINWSEVFKKPFKKLQMIRIVFYYRLYFFIYDFWECVTVYLYFIEFT